MKKNRKTRRLPGKDAWELANRGEGDKLSLKQAVLAKCYDCMGGYVDGRQDCGVNTCPLYRWMPYRTTKPAKKYSRKALQRPSKPDPIPPHRVEDERPVESHSIPLTEENRTISDKE